MQNHRKLFLPYSIMLLLLTLFTKLKIFVLGMLPNFILAPHSRRLLLRILVDMSIGMSLNLFWPFLAYF